MERLTDLLSVLAPANDKPDKIKANYQDWASSKTELSAWRMGRGDLAIDDDGNLCIYLVRPDSKRDTFTIEIDQTHARKLLEFLQANL